jgi:hypothetical protein
MKKKGGSQASSAVTKLVSPAAFEKMNSMFSNTFSVSGGTNCRKKALQKVDINETSGTNMMVYNKTGGKKTQKPRSKKSQKGGTVTDIFSNNTNNIINSRTMPPPAIPSDAPSYMNAKALSPNQQILISQGAAFKTMGPLVKTTAFPQTSADPTFAFGGAKGKKKAPAKRPKKKT